MSIARGKSHSFLEMKYFVSTFNIYLQHMTELKVKVGNKIKRTDRYFCVFKYLIPHSTPDAANIVMLVIGFYEVSPSTISESEISIESKI